MRSPDYGFKYIAILMKKIGQLQRKSNFSDSLNKPYEGVWGRRHVPNGGSPKGYRSAYGGLIPQ